MDTEYKAKLLLSEEHIIHALTWFLKQSNDRDCGKPQCKIKLRQCNHETTLALVLVTTPVTTFTPLSSSDPHSRPERLMVRNLFPCHGRANCNKVLLSLVWGATMLIKLWILKSTQYSLWNTPSTWPCPMWKEIIWDLQTGLKLVSNPWAEALLNWP